MSLRPVLEVFAKRDRKRTFGILTFTPQTFSGCNPCNALRNCVGNRIVLNGNNEIDQDLEHTKRRIFKVRPF